MSTPNTWIVPTTTILLTGYAIVAVIALASPGSDPQKSMAQGFISFVVFVLLCLGGLLWIGSHPYRPFLVWPIFLISAYPAVMYCAEKIYLFIRAWRNQ